jgi:hypothetical protein
VERPAASPQGATTDDWRQRRLRMKGIADCIDNPVLK